jgi:hypothetical protein
MMLKRALLFFVLCLSGRAAAQLPVARDTIPVIENGYVLKMPWANGINFANVSNLDLNGDGKKDLVVFDRLNIYGVGRFRCFIHTGAPGETKYRESWYHSYLFPPATNWAVFRDYDCDGKEDLFCSVSSGIKVFRNISQGSTFGFELVKSLILSDYNPGGKPMISNLYASSVGVPGIVDVDGDGDLDVLTFSPQGVHLQLHRNMSVEKGFSCDSLIYEYSDNCWGRISENNCEVNFNVCETSGSKNLSLPLPKTYHAGSCLTCFDSDGDKDIDLIMGDVTCNTVEYVHNTGSTLTALFTDSTKRYPNYPDQNNTVQIRMNNFPCAYYVDANGDGRNDLVVTPNSYGSENYKSMWLYRNASSTSTVDFRFVQNNFLQDEMIEVGQSSFPVIFDYDLDGRKDLLIGNYGYYNLNIQQPRLTLYRNIGSAAAPVYSLISRDYGSISTRSLASSLPINHAMPAVGDIDQDGDIDILFGTSSGQIHWLENTAGPGNVSDFSVFHENPFSFTTPSSAAAPQIFDLNNDGLPDLLIGMQNGRIAWYRNTGSPGSPSFSLATNFLGQVDVKGDPNLFGYEGYAVPFFYREDNVTHLLVGSFSGAISQYSVPADLNSPFTLITSAVNGYNEGSQSAVWYEDVNADGKRDLFIGNSGGGLNFFSSRSPLVNIGEYSITAPGARVLLFPNPAREELHLSIDLTGFQSAECVIRDLLGKEVLRVSLHATLSVLNTSALRKGLYFADIYVDAGLHSYNITKKIIKE